MAVGALVIREEVFKQRNSKCQVLRARDGTRRPSDFVIRKIIPTSLYFRTFSYMLRLRAAVPHSERAPNPCVHSLQLLYPLCVTCVCFTSVSLTCYRWALVFHKVHPVQLLLGVLGGNSICPHRSMFLNQGGFCFPRVFDYVDNDIFSFHNWREVLLQSIG